MYNFYFNLHIDNSSHPIALLTSVLDIAAL
jgi:hypothetical protein